MPDKNSRLACCFAAWATALAIDDIPAAIISAAQRAILDTVGVMIAATRHPTVAKLRSTFATEQGNCFIIGGGRTHAAAAALINGAAAHVYDFDDTSYTGIMHGSAVLLPAIFAASQEVGAADRRIVEAFIAGSEIAYVCADIITHAHYFKGWWSTATLGLIGATAAVAKIYELDAEVTRNALALAAAAAGGGKSVLGTDAKPYLVGDTARRAIDFAKVARAGLVGPRNGFEDERGFFALLCDGECAWDEANTLGQRWRFVDPGLLFKRYPICSAAHAAVDQTAELCEKASVSAEEIDTIECHIPELVNISLLYDAPETPQQAQFSLPYTVSCAVRYGMVRLDDLSLDALFDSTTRAIMKKIEKTIDPQLSSDVARKNHPESTRIIVNLKDGRRFEGFCGQAYGMPGHPLSNNDLKTKFESCGEFAAYSGDAWSLLPDILLTMGSATNNRAIDLIDRIIAELSFPSAPHGRTDADI